MNEAGHIRPLAACTGLIAGPAVWAVNMQLGQLLPYLECGSHVRSSALISALAILLALAGAGVSWHMAWPGQTGWFVSRLGALLSVMFAFALVLQAGAGLMLTGCER